MLDFRKSIATRLALGYGLLAAGSILVFSAMVYFGTIGVLDRSIDGKIRTISERLVALYENRPTADLLEEVDRQMRDGIDSDTEIFLVVAPDGRLLGGNLTAGVGPLTPVDEIVTENVVRYGKPVRARIIMRNFSSGQSLVIGRALQEQEAIRDLVLRALGTGGLIAVMLAVAGALIFRHLLQRRIADIRHTAEEIEGGNLSRRIPVVGNDEFSRLNIDINRMLDRIEQLMEGVRHVSNAIAHDLRTPLSRVRSKLDEALRDHSATKESLSDAALNAVEGIDDLIRLFDKLLQIAEAESGIRTQSFETVDLRRLVTDMVELYDAAAEEEGIQLAASGDQEVPAMGDHNLLASALASLIDNAIKYAGSGAKVEVSAVSGHDEAVLVVRDNGPGIPPDELSKVAQRFYRLDRSRNLPGNGLGLAIVAAIAKLHGGSLQLESPNGLTCRIVLPIIAIPGKADQKNLSNL